MIAIYRICPRDSQHTRKPALVKGHTLADAALADGPGAKRGVFAKPASLGIACPFPPPRIFEAGQRTSTRHFAFQRRARHSSAKKVLKLI